MEGKPGLALVLFQQFVVDVDLLPALQHFRLAGGQTGSHGEVGLRQVNGLVVVHCDAPYLKFGNLGNKKTLASCYPRDKGKNLCGTTLVAGKLPATHAPQSWGQRDIGRQPARLTEVRAACSQVIFHAPPPRPFTKTGCSLRTGQTVYSSCSSQLPYHITCIIPRKPRVVNEKYKNNGPFPPTVQNGLKPY